MTDDPRFRVPLLVVGALAVHLTLMPTLRVAGVAPDLMLLLAAASGLVGGPMRGAALGFVVGLAVDVFLRTPMGLSALVFTLVGYAVGIVSSGVLTPTWYLPVVTASLASAGGVLLFALLGGMLGEPIVNRRLVVIVGVVAAGNAVMALPVIKATRWALGDSVSPVPTLRRGRSWDEWR